MALFANQRNAPTASPFLTEMKAGKCRISIKPDDADAMTVTAVEGPGLIYLNQTEDMLTRFCYKNLTTNQTEDELIVFAGDAVFVAVDEMPDARVFLFKFKNSGTERWHMYWMQEADADKDADRCKKMNDLMNGERPAPTAGGRGGAQNLGVEALQQMLGLPAADTAQLLQSIPPAQLQQLLGSQIGGLDPAALLGSLGATPRGGAGAADNMTTPMGQVSGTPAIPPAAPTRGAQRRQMAPTTTEGGGTGIQLSQLQNALSGVTQTPAAQPTLSDLFPSDSSGAAARKLVSATADKHASTLQSLLPHQPPTLTNDKEELSHTLTSPQFQQAVQTLDAALQSGQGGTVLRQFGLSEAVAVAADGADVAAMAESLEAGKSDGAKTTEEKEEKKKSTEEGEEDAATASTKAKAPSAKRNRKEGDDDDSEQPKTVEDGMDLD